METKEIVAKKVEEYRSQGINKVKVAITDIDGVLRGKYISLDKFASIAAETSGFCDCVLGWDMDDQLYDNAKFTGWHTAFPDALYKLDLETERRLPDEGNIPFFIGEFVDQDKKSIHPIGPRSLLRRVLERAENLGLGINLAFEYEFFIFKETAQSVREKNFQELSPLSPGNFGYSILRSSIFSDLFSELMDYCSALDCPLESVHCETGPGVWEAAITYDQGMKAVDKASLFKTFTKVFFQKREMIATFMAKWSMDYPGQSGHCHQSVYDLKTGKNLFHDRQRHGGMSALMEQYVAGQKKYLQPFLAMFAPTINSYTRLVKGAWAPTAATWGIENRTTALRVIPGTEKSQRVEFRLGSADANPYLVAAGTIAAGILGIEQKLTLDAPIVGNAYEVQDDLPPELQLPGNLRDATRNFAASAEAREFFGQAFVEHFVSSREWECREYERHLNDWQLKRYFELI